jgi:hypothetical protein
MRFAAIPSGALIVALLAGAALAQSQSQRAAPARPGAATAAAPPAARDRVDHTTAEFAGLDKITGRIIKFDVRIGETVQFGALQVTPRACAQRLVGTHDHVGFVEVDEITLRNEIRRIFNGWMFAASPGLNAVEHPIYDVWLSECKGGTVPQMAAGPRAGYQGDPESPAVEGSQPAVPAPRRAPQPRPPQAQPPRAPTGLQPGVPFDPATLPRR